MTELTQFTKIDKLSQRDELFANKHQLISEHHFLDTILMALTTRCEIQWDSICRPMQEI
jgi:hypothetical protein